MRNQSLLGVTVITTLLVTGANVDADTIVFSNLGPGGTYDPGAGWVVGDVGHDYDQATRFTPSRTSRLISLELGISFDEGTNALDVWLMTDENGWPGTIIENVQVFNLPQFGSSATELTNAASVLRPLLRLGTPYWVAASGVESHSFFAWNWNVTGDIGIVGRIDGGPWMRDPGIKPAGALRVNAVPEPTAVGLLGVTAVALILRRRHSRCRAHGCATFDGRC